MVATNSGSDGMVSTSEGDGVTAGSEGVGTTTVSFGDTDEGAGGGVELISPPSIEGAEQPTSNNVTEAAQASEVKRMH